MQSLRSWPLLMLVFVSCSVPVAPGSASSPVGTTIPSAGSTAAETPETSAPAPCSSAVATDIAYRSIEGVDPQLLSLDVYPVADRCDAPVAVWVHGGGWSVGDKSNAAAQRAEFYNAQGWMLVAVNYRLSTPHADPPVRYPDHNEDVAAALAWVFANAGGYGGDPGKMFVVGHSAGAGIAASIASDPALLAAHGLTPADLDCVVLLDTAAYDVAGAAAGVSEVYRNAFGDDPAVWAEASPIVHVGDGALPARILIVTRGGPARVGDAQSFADLLDVEGVDVQLVDASPLSHRDVNMLIGTRDAMMTPLLVGELARCAR